MNFTPIVRPWLVSGVRRVDRWGGTEAFGIQAGELRGLLLRNAGSETGRRYDFRSMAADRNPVEAFRQSVPLSEYEDIREDVMRMIRGERDVLWPGPCTDFAQSSGTSGAPSKFIPVTSDSLRRNHYRGASDTVGLYLRCNPRSRMFAGKGMVLGGSFSNTLGISDERVHIGDLSATLIRRMPPGANLFRVPDRETALLPDWEEKLPLLASKSMCCDITNISGVPSWFLTVLKLVCRLRGVRKISDAWPNLEVFFHGGISFEPYRETYRQLTDSSKIHFFETYNASEGFFACQDSLENRGMLLLLDAGIFYEFIELGGENPVTLAEVEPGKIYEMVITASNGLTRYRIGDTVRFESVLPPRIRIVGRTRTFINAFGEELMEDNAERGIAEACRLTGAVVANYTAGPVYARGERRGRHQWVVEWAKKPDSIENFASLLDRELQKLNSDYAAKRSHTIFLDPPEIVSVPGGSFDAWLKNVGTGKLGGQRKVPRLSNDRKILDSLLPLAGSLS